MAALNPPPRSNNPIVDNKSGQMLQVMYLWVSTLDASLRALLGGGNPPPISRPTRIITSSSSPQSILTTDYAVGLNRTSTPAAMTLNLPNASAGFECLIQDLAANLQAFPVTVAPPGGQTIAGLASFVMNVNRQSAYFLYYGSNLWGVEW